MSNADEPAFPVTNVSGGTQPDGDIRIYTEGEEGLTKRELFAVIAMRGFVSSTMFQPPDTGNGAITYAAYAKSAVKMADALLAELAK